MRTPDILQNHPEQRANSARRRAGVFSWPLRTSLTLLVLSTLAHARPGHSQTENTSASESTSNTLIFPSSMPSEEAYQQLITSYDGILSEQTSEINQVAPKCSEFVGEASLSCYEFIRFNGQQGEFFTEHGTKGVFANGRTGFIDTTEFYLDRSLKAKAQAPYRLYPEDTYDIVTAGHQYHPADLAYFIDGYRKASADPDYIPLVIRVVPLEKITEPNAHSLLNITLPAGIVTGDPVRSFQFAPDFSYIDVGTKNYADKDLNRINRVYLNKDATATGKVDILQYPPVYKTFISSVLNQFRPGFLIGWLGRYLH